MPDALNPVMNDTKWQELRRAMLAITPPPLWSTLSMNGHQSAPDREWFYHFQDGGYADIVSVDIIGDDDEHRAEILSALQIVHVPGENIVGGFRVFGYVKRDHDVDYL